MRRKLVQEYTEKDLPLIGFDWRMRTDRMNDEEVIRAIRSLPTHFTNNQLQETDTSTGGDSPGTAQCSGAAVAQAPQFRLASATGVPGVAVVNVVIDSNLKSPPQQFGICFATPAGEPNLTSWAAGNYVVRLNVINGNADLTWTATYVCRVNSGLVNQATVGSLTGQTTSMTAAGIKTHTISGSSQSASASDRLYFVLLFTNAAAALRSFDFTPNQLIDTPLSGSSPTGANILATYQNQNKLLTPMGVPNKLLRAFGNT